MAGATKHIKGYEACSGCGICLLVCPLWRKTGSISYTRKFRARAMQGGASIDEITGSIDACLMCGSCEPACPEGIGIEAMNLEQRRMLNQYRSHYPSWYPEPGENISGAYNKAARKTTVILAGEYLGDRPETINCIIELLGGSKTVFAPDDGRDIASAIEAGLPVSGKRIEKFIAPLRNAGSLIAAEGILHRPLKKWLPGKKITGLGEALMNSAAVRKALGPDDIYIIECRGYHSDFKRLVRFYDKLRQETGCRMNLDLQRIAIATGASSLQARHNMEAAGCLDHARWILKGQNIRRVVVEDIADQKIFQGIADLPVIHISGLGTNTK